MAKDINYNYPTSPLPFLRSYVVWRMSETWRSPSLAVVTGAAPAIVTRTTFLRNRLNGLLGVEGWAWDHSQEAAIAPKHATRGHSDEVITGATFLHYHAHFVPALRDRVLRADMSSDIQWGQWAGMRIVGRLGSLISSGGTSLTLLRLLLPHRSEGRAVCGNTGAQGASIQDLCWGTTILTWRIPQFQQTAVEFLIEGS